METAHDNVRRNDYKEYMKTSMNATAELLDSIERDIEESRQFIQSMNSEESILTQLVSTLKEDNEILLNKVQVLEAELASMHEQSVRNSNDLYMEFEEKILACNGEIERVVAQCDEANNERVFLKEEVSKLEHLCTGYSDELNQARLSVQSKNFQVQRLQIENEQLKSELSRSKDELKAITDTHQNTLQRILILEEEEQQIHLQQPPQQQQEGFSMYPDQDIADIIERVKYLEEQNLFLTRSQPSPHPTSTVKENNIASLPESLKSVSLQDMSISKRVVSFDASMYHQEAGPASSTSLPSAATRPAPANSSGLSSAATRPAPVNSSSLPSAGSVATPLVSSTPSAATAMSPMHSPKAPKGYLTLPDSASSPYTKPYFSSTAMNSLSEQLHAHTNTQTTKHSTTSTATPTTSTLQPAVTHPEEYSHLYPAHQLSSSGSTYTQLASNSSEQEPLHTSRSQLSVSQRQFASPESDEGHPFELEEDYVPPNSRNATSFTTHKTHISEHSPDHHYRESDFSYSGEYSTPYVTRTSLGSSGQPDSGGSPPFLGLYQSHQVPLQQLESDMSPVVSYLSGGEGTTTGSGRQRVHVGEVVVEEDGEREEEEGYRYEAVERSPHSSQLRQSVDAPPRRSADAPRRSSSSSSGSRSSNSSSNNSSSTSSSPRHITTTTTTTTTNSNQLPALHSTSTNNMRLSQRPNPDTSYISQEDEDDSGSSESLSSQHTGVELPHYSEDGANFNENNTENDYYPDDFETESYDDNIGGYTDDDQEPLGYRDTGNDRDSVELYRDTGNDRSSSGDSNSDDGGMQNVFMYDGSVVEGDSLALDFDPSIGLDELSRLSI